MTDRMCSACEFKRVHRPEEWRNHPWAGHGYQERLGWSHPDLAVQHDVAIAGAAAKPNARVSGEAHATGAAPAAAGDA